ncbi:MAG: tetratricopeptide repeat protein [Candidatus Buchananbacteria bacterium]|nr:tetratricopeptide repeat protein [Candidatus Buchananbacteria bacterium]
MPISKEEKIPKEAYLLFEEANQLKDLRAQPLAIQKYTEAIEIYPNFWEALDNRGLTKMDFAQVDFNQNKEAILDFEKSLLINPQSFVALFSIGECYFRLGEYNKALAKLQECLKIDPGNKDPEHKFTKQAIEDTKKRLNAK